MSPLVASLLLGAGGLLLAGWAGCVLFICVKKPGPDSRTVLAATRLSGFQTVGGMGCGAVFATLWAGELSARAAGETASVDWLVLCLSGGLAVLGFTILWMTLVRRVWCTGSALVQRTWRGVILTAPYRELQGGKAVFSYDDVFIPWGEGRLTLDSSLPGFEDVAELLEKQGIDMSDMPPKRGWNPFSGRK